jgi:hypothetical protein
MACRDTAKLAMASDPARNRWFSYAWVLPPPLVRIRRPAGPRTADFASTLSTKIYTAGSTKTQVRRAAERLFSLRGAACR